MSDRYQQFTSTAFGRALAKRLGLPTPTPLRRHRPGDPVISGKVRTGAAAGSRLHDSVRALLSDVGAEVDDGEAREDDRYAALVFDASGITSSDQLHQLRDFFGPLIRQVGTCGRVIVLGTPPEECTATGERVAQRALEGFVRTVGKELKRGATAQLVYASEGVEAGLPGGVREAGVPAPEHLCLFGG